MNDLKERINKNIHKGVVDNYLSNDDLVQIIEHAGTYLRTRSAYAKEQGVSYNAAKKYRKNIIIFGVKFIIDNV